MDEIQTMMRDHKVHLSSERAELKMLSSTRSRTQTNAERSQRHEGGMQKKWYRKYIGGKRRT